MKKLMTVLVALMLAVTCMAACAEAVEVDPVYDVDMEAYGIEDSTVAAAIDPQNIDENNCLVYDVYATDLYETEKIKALQPGDVLYVNGEAMAVESVEESEYGFDINGGFIDSEGASLCYVNGDPDHLYSLTYDDVKAQTMIGQAAFQMADTVSVKTFRMTEDLDFNDEYDEVSLPASEVKAYLQQLVDGGMVFSPDSCTVRLEGGKVVEIFNDWTPNA